MSELANFCCLNLQCPDHGKRGGENLSVCAHYGKAGEYRLLHCGTCGARFSERKGTPLFNTRLAPAKVDDVMRHLAEGLGIRATSRLTGVSRDTITRLILVAGKHAASLHDEKAAFSPSNGRGANGREMGVRGQKGRALRSGGSGKPS